MKFLPKGEGFSSNPRMRQESHLFIFLKQNGTKVYLSIILFIKIIFVVIFLTLSPPSPSRWMVWLGVNVVSVYKLEAKRRTHLLKCYYISKFRRDGDGTDKRYKRTVKCFSLGMDYPDNMFYEPIYKLFSTPWVWCHLAGNDPIHRS